MDIQCSSLALNIRFSSWRSVMKVRGIFKNRGLHVLKLIYKKPTRVSERVLALKQTAKTYRFVLTGYKVL